MVKFIDFVKAAKHDSRPETSVSMLTEAKIVSSKNQFWPKFSIYDFLRIAGFSSQWNSKSDVGTLKIKATEEQLQALNAYLEGLKSGFGWDSGFMLDLSWKEMSKDSQLIFRTQNGEVAQQFEELSNEITKKYNSSDCQVNYKKIEKPIFIQVEDPATGKKKKVPDPDGKKLFGQAILNVKGPQAKIDEIVSILNGAALKGVNLDVKKFDPNAQIDGQMTGDFNVIVTMLVKLLEIQGKTGLNMYSNEVVEYLNNNFEFKQDLDDETKWLAQCAYKSIYNPNNTDDEHIESVGAYCNFLKSSNVALAIRKFHILRKAEIDTVANKKEEAKKALIDKAEVDVDGKPLIDKDQLKAALDAAEVEAKSTWKIGKTLLQVPSMKSLFDIVGFTKKEGEEEDASKSKKAKIDLVESPDFDTGTAGGRCAERRMKLFAAAEKRGAKVLKTASYVVAVCTNAKQVMPFCRYKPKVKPGTNEIDPACNLEDWEGITPENKKKRDDGSGKYETIRDGIDDGHGHSFDRLVGEHGQSANGVQFAEAAWCVGGSLGGNYYWGYEGNQSSFNNYTEGGKRPLIVFMDVKRGALYLYAKFLKNGSILENILNENEKCDGASPTSSNPTDAMQQQFVKTMEMSSPDFKKVKNYIEKIYYPDFDPDIDEEEPEFDSSTAGGRCAARRMKLFAAAEHYGATVIKTKDWVAAVCTQGAQAHQFGRLKPIVKPGTNEIDPACNLEDWEGITPENKKKRDDETNGDRIRDGIDDGHGKSFDRLARVSGQYEAVKYAESAWCVCGACSGAFKWDDYVASFFSSYSQNGKYPITVFMSTKRGAMYMYSNKDGEQNFDNESDCIDGSNKGNPYTSEQTAFLNKFRIADPSFEYLHTKIRNTYYSKTGSGNSQAKTPEQLLKEAQDDGHLSQNGWLRIDSRPDALKYQPIFGDVAGLFVNKQDASNFFQGVDLQLVSVIDFCNKVQSAAAMFYQANIGSIKIINSRSLRNAYQMFRLAILEDLQQLETPNLESAEEMFYKVTPSKGGTLSVPSFDLQKCRTIKHMFYETNIQNVNLRNVQNIENAYGAYFHCPQLASYPETKFPKILNLKTLTIDGSESAAMMFPNCLTLQSKKKRQRYNTNPDLDFDACVADTEQYYANNQKSENTDLFDERGFLRIKSKDDVSKYLNDFKKFPGIVIELEDASHLFEGKNVNVKVIDVSKVKTASYMFAEANLYQLQDIIGTETIEYAEALFSNSNARILPDMVFNSLKECKFMLRSCNYLKALPSITINGGAQLLEKLGFYYVFGDEDNLQTMLKAVGGKARCETWLNAQIKRIGVKIPELLKFHQDSKFVEVDSKELARFVVKNWNLAQKNMGAEGIYIKMQDTTDLFYGFNSYMDSNTKNKDLVFPVIDGSEITTANNMFKNVEVKKFSGLINFGKLTSAKSMFSSCRITDGGIPEFDTSKIGNAAYMFYGCVTAEELPKLDFSAVTIAEGMFQSSLVFKQGFDLANIWLPNAENCSYMFKTIHTIAHGEEGMLTCSGLSLPKAKTCYEMFRSAKINGVVGDIVLPEADDISHMFAYDENITEVKSIQAPKARYCKYIFSNCGNLTTIGIVQLPSVRTIDYGFKDTTSLQKIMVPGFNTSGYNFDASGAFKNSGLVQTFGVKMEKWKSVSSLFALMDIAAA